jgi:hypothetical protein
MENTRAVQAPEAVMNSTASSVELVCRRCGGTHFMVAEYRRYWKFTSSFPGGELRAASDPVRVYHCLCGEPVTYAGPLPYRERQAFTDS